LPKPLPSSAQYRVRPFDLLGVDILKLQSTHYRSQFHTHIIEHGFDVFALTRRVASLLQLFLGSVEGFGNLGYRYFVRASFQA
jgi:hypothetical protein